MACIVIGCSPSPHGRFPFCVFLENVATSFRCAFGRKSCGPRCHKYILEYAGYNAPLLGWLENAQRKIQHRLLLFKKDGTWVFYCVYHDLRYGVQSQVNEPAPEFLPHLASDSRSIVALLFDKKTCYQYQVTWSGRPGNLPLRLQPGSADIRFAARCYRCRDWASLRWIRRSLERWNGDFVLSRFPRLAPQACDSQLVVLLSCRARST